MTPRTDPSGNAPPPPPPRLTSTLSKASVQSQSFDADDELSHASTPTMRQVEAGSRGLPRYPGEDVRLTSKKELAGWYSYGWAAEVYVICGIGSFIPITLEQLARERGVLLSDGVTPCGSSSVGKPSTSTVDNGQCVIYFLGLEINTASFAMYTFSLSVLLQAVLIISMSGAADHGKYRKTLLLSLAFIGAFATMLFLTVVPKIYLLGALLAVVSNVCFGASFVLLNSFLPLLVRYHPSVQEKSSEGLVPSATSPNGSFEVSSQDDEPEDVGEPLVSSLDALLPVQLGSDGRGSTQNQDSPELKLSTQISSYGIGIGYCAAVFLQSASIVIVVLTGSTTFSLRLVLFVIGLWWFVFSIPAALWLRPRPGPPLPSTRLGEAQRSWAGYVGFAWKSLGKTILKARQLKDVVFFLIAWFLLSDAIATVSGTAVLFAKTQLKMKPAALALISLTGTVFGVLGAFTWSIISRWFGLRPSHTILACICLFEVIPLYGLLGYVPAIQRIGVFGLQQPWEMYPLGAIYGFVLGGISSYCRSLFGELIPPGYEAAFYALYAITDKGSSIFGPAIVGIITDTTGSIRPAFFFLAFLIGLPAPLMWLVDVDRGRMDGEAMSKELNKAHGSHGVDGVVEDQRGLLHDSEAL